MKHDLRLDQLGRETWLAYCSCGHWSSRFTLDHVPFSLTRDLETIAEHELTYQHQVHVAAERRDLP